MYVFGSIGKRRTRYKYLFVQVFTKAESRSTLHNAQLTNTDEIRRERRHASSRAAL